MAENPGAAWELGQRCRNILACTLSELPASHGLCFVGNLQHVLLRRVEMVDCRSEQVRNETRLVPVLGMIVLWTHSRLIDNVVMEE